MSANAVYLRRIPAGRVRKRTVFQTIVLGRIGSENEKWVSKKNMRVAGATFRDM